MTSLNMSSYTEFQFQISRPRRKARRSCLYCQKAHKTCGNERPCGQCIRRNMPSQCVDGNRKPPKYLNDEYTKKAPKANFYGDVTCLQGTQGQQEDTLSITRNDNKVTEKQAIDETHIQDHRIAPFEEVFDELIDSNFFYSGNDNFTPFFSNVQCSTWPEVSSSESEDSEVGMPYRGLEGDFGASLGKIHNCARAEPFSGFAISSGWSSTFFPHGIEEQPHG